MSSLARTWVNAFRANGSETGLDRHLQGLPVYRPLQSMAEMANLAGKVIKAIVTPPYSWVRETVVESSHILRVTIIPMVFASLVYVLAFGSVIFAEVVAALGASDRLGPGFYVGLLREIATWLCYMILAAIMASALAADLGARKVREELDALAVLGVDKMRTLIVPRVVAMTICGVILALLIVFIDLICMIALDTVTVNTGFRTQIEAVVLTMNPYDLGAALIKNTILGFFLGLVACQKGLSARGGAEGVGRAVSETVVITFFGIWLINSIFNTGYLTVVPDALGIKG